MNNAIIAITKYPFTIDKTPIMIESKFDKRTVYNVPFAFPNLCEKTDRINLPQSKGYTGYKFKKKTTKLNSIICRTNVKSGNVQCSTIKNGTRIKLTNGPQNKIHISCL